MLRLSTGVCVIAATNALSSRHNSPLSRAVSLDRLSLHPTASTDPDEVQHASRDVPVQRVDGRGMHPHENTLVLDARRLDLAQLEHVRQAICFLDNCFHVTVSCMVQMRAEEAAIRPRED
jgi:hypothetical protein